MPTVAIDESAVLQLASRESEYNQRRAMGGLVEPDDSGGGLATDVIKVNQFDLTMPWSGFNNYLNNCGPACVSMVLWQARQVRKWPDEVADWMRGENHQGYTNSTDLDRYLDAHGVPSEHGQFTSLDDFKARIRDQVAANRLTIILVWGNFSTNMGGHFVVPYGCDEPDAEIQVMNPWHGVVNKYTWEKLYSELKRGRYRVLALRGADSYDVKPESWTAYTTAGLNVRAEPFTRKRIEGLLPSGRQVRLVAFTDQGTAIGPNGNRRWHKLEGGGWVTDFYLYRWQRV